MKELNSLRNRPVKHRQWPCVYQCFMLLRMSISSAMFMWHPETSSALATNSALLYACRLKLGGLVLCYNKTLHRTNMGKRSLTRKIPRFIFPNAKTYGKSSLITYYATYGCPCKPSIVEGLGATPVIRISYGYVTSCEIAETVRIEMAFRRCVEIRPLLKTYRDNMVRTN